MRKWTMSESSKQDKDAEQLTEDGSTADHRGSRVVIEYFANEHTVKDKLAWYIIKNRHYSLRVRVFSLTVKVVACILYVIRVMQDNGPKNATCYGCSKYNYYDPDLISIDDYVYNSTIFYPALLWVDRPLALWILESIAGIIGFIEMMLFLYVNYKGNIWRQLDAKLCVEVITTTPFLVSLVFLPLRNLFVPSFLACWLAKNALEGMMNDLHRALQKQQSALRQQMAAVLSIVSCLVFTSACGIQHLQRAGRQHMNIFQSFYLIVVTFSTVGYGELHPDIWVSQCFMIVMICVAFIILPAQIEQLVITWMEQQKCGGEYSSHRAKVEKHVVVTTTAPTADTIMDFLNEFCSHAKLQDYFVVILSPTEIDRAARMVLKNPLWSERVICLQGSALKETDLERAQVCDAEACFILGNRNTGDKSAADEHTILRSWAIKDYAPKCPQYVQIFRPESKMHVKHSENVICEDEFKYALMANNAICPGISTFLTLLLHTSRGEEGQTSTEAWHRLYGKHSGNEIYHVRAGSSKFFSEFVGKSFSYTSYHAHRKCGVGLIAVQPDIPGATILLNPGPYHMMKATDTCFYMSITEEEHSALVESATSPKSAARKNKSFSNGTGTSTGFSCCGKETESPEKQLLQGVGNQHNQAPPNVVISTSDLGNSFITSLKEAAADVELVKLDNNTLLQVLPASKRPSIASVLSVPEYGDLQESETLSTDLSGAGSSNNEISSCGQGCTHDYASRFPPVTPYIGTSATLCHLLKQKKQLCCLQLAQACAHCHYKNAKDYNWKNQAIIVAADFASSGIYNFILPLRTHFRPKHELKPIVLLLEKKPDLAFLDSISWFPDVYWMIGSIDCLDDLLSAGIHLSDHVVVVNKESSNSAGDDYLADCNTIVAVQTMHRLFPTVRIITELSHSSNMRFMHFNAKDTYALCQSEIEKEEKQKGSHMAYMFRLPFAAGNIFSASMLDTLMYQACVKDYLIQFVRLLLGIDQAIGSGYLSCVRITKSELWLRTYGRFYQRLCSTTGDVPMGIYRTQAMTASGCTVKPGSLRLDSGDCPMDRTYSSRYMVSEKHEILNLVRCRMETLHLPDDDYYYTSDKRASISYVILNPSYELLIQEGDIVYVLKPSTSKFRFASTQAMKEMRTRQRSMTANQRTQSRKHFGYSGSDPKLNHHNQPTLTETSPTDGAASMKNKDSSKIVDQHQLAIGSSSDLEFFTARE